MKASWLAVTSMLTAVAQAAHYAPTHFLGSCFNEEWVAATELSLGVSAMERDTLTGALVHPFLHAALRQPRYTVREPSKSIALRGDHSLIIAHFYSCSFRMIGWRTPRRSPHRAFQTEKRSTDLMRLLILALVQH